MFHKNTTNYPSASRSHKAWTWHTTHAGMAILIAAICTSSLLGQVRIKDITTVEGQRMNVLTGMGLVTGLANTGGKSPITRQFALNMVQNFGIRADPAQRLAIINDTKMRTNNMSVVTVTTEMPVYVKKGTRLSVKIAAFDDASSLLGGQLQTTPLFGVDGVVYATAAGPINLGGFAFGGDAANVQQNHPTSGIGVNAAVVEEEICDVPEPQGRFRLILNQPNFETATRIVEAINELFPGVAAAEDFGTIEILVPSRYSIHETQFMAAVGELVIRPDALARVVINERTGTVVMGEHVRIGKTALVHANLAVLTSESPEVSQPAPFSEGVTTVAPRTELNVVQEKKSIQVLNETVTVGDLAAALNALGASPRDLSSIFHMLHESGQLHAHLEFH